MDDAGLVELAGDAEQLLELLLAEVVEHPRVDHVGGEALGVLGEPEVGQPLRADPGVPELGYARVAHEIRMAVLLDREPQLLAVQRVAHSQARLQLGVAQLQEDLRSRGTLRISLVGVCNYGLARGREFSREWGILAGLFRKVEWLED